MNILRAIGQSRLLIGALIGLLWVLESRGQAAQQNWQQFVEAVGTALYADDPLAALNRLKEQVAAERAAGKSRGYSSDPLKLIRRAEQFSAQLPDSLGQQYEREKAFWGLGDVDTTFHALRVDLTGDAVEDRIFAQVSRVGLKVYLRLFIAAEGDTTDIDAHAIQLDDSQFPVPQMRRRYDLAIRCGKRPDLMSAQKLFIIPQFAIGEVAHLTGLEAEEVAPTVRAYVEAFSGKAICISNGVGGSCHFYYAPLARFVLLYKP